MDKTIFTDYYGRYKFSSLQDLLMKYPYEKPIGESSVKGLMEDLSQSLYYRQLLRDNAWDVALQMLNDEAPELQNQIDVTHLAEAIKETQASLGSIDIVCVDCTEKIHLNGRAFKGIDEIKKQWREQKLHNRCILAAYDRFPCFDSYDYANEDRNYWNFWFTNNAEYEKLQQLIEGQSHRSDYCFLTEKLPAALTPMVYYKDGSKVMLVAT